MFEELFTSSFLLIIFFWIMLIGIFMIGALILGANSLRKGPARSY